MLRTYLVCFSALALIATAIATTGRADDSPGQQYIVRVEGGDPAAALGDGTWITLGRYNSYDEALAAEQRWNDAHPGNLRMFKEDSTNASSQPDSTTRSLEDGDEAVKRFNEAADRATEAIHAAEKGRGEAELAGSHGAGDTLKEWRQALGNALDRVVHLERTLTSMTRNRTAAELDRVRSLIADYNREAANYDVYTRSTGQSSVPRAPALDRQLPTDNYASGSGNPDAGNSPAPTFSGVDATTAPTGDGASDEDGPTPQNPGYVRTGRPASGATTNPGIPQGRTGRSYPDGQRFRIINPGYQGSPASVIDMGPVGQQYPGGFRYDEGRANNPAPASVAGPTYAQNSAPSVGRGSSFSYDSSPSPGAFPSSPPPAAAPVPSSGGAPKGVLMRLGIDPRTLEKSDVPQSLLERLHKAS